MPSARRQNEFTHDDLPSDRESDDPDYRESSADEEEDELPRTMARDRAQWVVDNTEIITELYSLFKANGRVAFGEAFFQTGNITSFAHFVYRYTTPGAS